MLRRAAWSIPLAASVLGVGLLGAPSGRGPAGHGPDAAGAVLAAATSPASAASPARAASPTAAGPFTAAAVDPRGGGWAATASGRVTAFAGAPSLGSVTVGFAGSVVALVATRDGRGYWLATEGGRVFAFGDARWHGSPSAEHRSGRVSGMAVTPDGRGYWITTDNGRVLTFGDARFYGSLHAAHVRVDTPTTIVPTPSGRGYWVTVGSGRVIAYGDAASLAAGPARFTRTHAVRPARSGPAVTVVAGGHTYRFWHARPARKVHHGATTVGGAPVAPVAPVAPAGPALDAAAASEAAVGRPFGPDSIWNAALGADSPTTADSAALVADFVDQYEAVGGTVGINTTSWSSPDYTVPADQPTVDVRALNCWGGSWVDPALTAQLRNVPIPAGAVAAAGTDGDMIVYQPATGTEWELWQASQVNGQWQACAGGRIDDTASASGIFPAPYGVAASGLSLLGGQIHLSDIAAGSIDHALEIQLPQTAKGAVAAPADRTDGWSTAADAIPEGTRFRLNPALDLASLHLAPAALEIARALQTYGMIVSDTSGAVNFIAQDPTPLVDAGHADPYDAWFAGTPSYQVLAGIPWDQLRTVAP